MELPPRARRILIFWIPRVMWVGTTSACAENTHATPAPAPANGNYLRVRGEYAFQTILTIRVQELPPRARRIRVIIQLDHGLSGTTSACAENTYEGPSVLYSLRNYLRVRGEYSHTT